MGKKKLTPVTSRQLAAIARELSELAARYARLAKELETKNEAAEVEGVETARAGLKTLSRVISRIEALFDPAEDCFSQSVEELAIRIRSTKAKGSGRDLETKPQSAPHQEPPRKSPSNRPKPTR